MSDKPLKDLEPKPIKNKFDNIEHLESRVESAIRSGQSREEDLLHAFLIVIKEVKELKNNDEPRKYI